MILEVIVSAVVIDPPTHLDRGDRTSPSRRVSAEMTEETVVRDETPNLRQPGDTSFADVRVCGMSDDFLGETGGDRRECPE